MVWCGNISEVILKSLLNVLALLVAVAIFLLDVFLDVRWVIGIYGLLILGYVSFKLLSSELYRRREAAPASIVDEAKECDVAIAFYNEDPQLLVRSVRSILAQRGVKLGNIVVVDDGSRSTQTLTELQKEFATTSNVILVRSEVNEGKRHALARGFRFVRAPHVALVDSDTILEPDALAHMLRRMGPGVNVVTANIRALNAQENWLTKLIDARYRNAFAIERAAQASLRSVLCASGVLSVYRTEVIRSHMGEWVNQRFLGRPVQIGDDRRLTSFALRTGGSVIALDAIAYTLVPNNLKQFLRQQLRWNKSFLRESVLSIKDFGVLRWPGFLSFVELFFWVFFLINTAHAVFFDRTLGIGTLSITWIAYVLTSGILRNITLIYREPRLVFAVPLYSLLHVVVLSPLRLVSLLTIVDTRWGTR